MQALLDVDRDVNHRDPFPFLDCEFLRLATPADKTTNQFFMVTDALGKEYVCGLESAEDLRVFYFGNGPHDGVSLSLRRLCRCFSSLLPSMRQMDC